MSGISGIIGSNKNNILDEQIHKMNQLITHRGPNGEEVYHDESFAFGQRLLTISQQPMEYMDRYVVTYNGRIFNYIELRDELKNYGYKFVTESDTEVILASYDYWGKTCLDHFNGMWAFALFDKKERIVFCARDRFGVKPFYYTQKNNYFYFGSEIKQFTSIDGWVSVANTQKVLDFLKFSIFDHTNETLFKDVYQLRGGEYLCYSLDNNQFEIKKWYDLNTKIKKSTIGYEEAVKKFRNLFVDAIQIMMKADVKAGSLLSGGLDSSSIVCVASDLLKREDKSDILETVSSCFHDKKYDEQQYIDMVLKDTNIKGHKIFPEFEDLIKDLDKIAWFQDEPFVSTSIFAQWSVFKEAKKNNLLVMLDGQGSDEQLAGYNIFQALYLEELLFDFRIKKFFKTFKNYKNKYRAYYASPIRGFLSKKIRNFKKLYWAIKNIRKNVASYTGWIKCRSEHDVLYLAKNVYEESMNEMLYTGLPSILHYEDRNAMAHSIEFRVPFLDYRLVEFVLSLPSEYKIGNGISKRILRDAMSEYVPKEIIERYDKLAFVTPEEVWIRNNNEMFRNEISQACDKLSSIVDKEKVLAWFDTILSSEQKFDYAFWKIISLGRWCKVFNVQL